MLLLTLSELLELPCGCGAEAEGRCCSCEDADAESVALELKQRPIVEVTLLWGVSQLSESEVSG